MQLRDNSKVAGFIGWTMLFAWQVHFLSDVTWLSRKEYLPFLNYSKVLSLHIFYKLLNEIFSFSSVLERKMPLFITVRHNSWVYNACKFKYWVYWFHFSQTKLCFGSPYVLLCPVVSNFSLFHPFIYFCCCRAVFLRRFKGSKKKTLCKNCLFQIFYKLFLLNGLITDQLNIGSVLAFY